MPALGTYRKANLDVRVKFTTGYHNLARIKRENVPVQTSVLLSARARGKSVCVLDLQQQTPSSGQSSEHSAWTSEMYTAKLQDSLKA